MKTIISSIFLLLAGVALAGERREVPHELFGVPLGAIVSADPAAEDRLLGLPGIEVKAAEKFLGQGIHVYFKPSKEYAGFPYSEWSSDPSNRFPRTTFRLYLLPIIPENITTSEQLAELTNSEDLEFEIALIEWRREPEGETADREAYWDARRLCATFSLDFSVKPEFRNDWDWHKYQCDFTQGDRLFSIVGQFGATQVSVQYREEIAEGKQNALEDKFKRLELERIRPY
jgi:hypothetical protein